MDLQKYDARHVEAVALAARLTEVAMAAVRVQQVPPATALLACGDAMGRLLLLLEADDREPWAEAFIAALRASVHRANEIDRLATH